MPAHTHTRLWHLFPCEALQGHVMLDSLDLHLYPVILSFCHPQHATQASTRRMLGTSSVQSALHIVSAMEKGLLSAAVRRASSGLRKIPQLWLVLVRIHQKK